LYVQMEKNKKVKHKTLRIEIRVTPLFLEIIKKEINYRNTTISKFMKRAVTSHIVGYSLIYHQYTDEQKEYIGKQFIDGKKN